MNFNSEEVQSKTLDQYFGGQSTPSVENQPNAPEVVQLPPIEEEPQPEPECDMDSEIMQMPGEDPQFLQEPECAPSKKIPLFGEMSNQRKSTTRNTSNYLYYLMGGGLLLKLLSNK